MPIQELISEMAEPRRCPVPDHLQRHHRGLRLQPERSQCCQALCHLRRREQPARDPKHAVEDGSPRYLVREWHSRRQQRIRHHLQHWCYTAPPVVPVPINQVTIGSSSSIYPSKGSYQVAVLNPIPIVNTITPGAFSEGKAQIIVAGSAFVYGAKILWNGTPVETTYISGTQLAAIITENTPGTYPVTVVNPDPGSASSKSINALVQPGQVVIKLQPTETFVRVNNTITITPTVTGSQDICAQLDVNGIAGGNAQIGTIDAKGVYTAPPVVPQPNLVVVRATSVDNPNSITIVNVQVLNPVPILLSAAPANLNIGSATVVLTGASFINGATALENGVAVPTQFNSSTQLTATVNPTVAGPFDLQVLNPDPGAAVSARCGGAGRGYSTHAAGHTRGCFALPDAVDLWRLPGRHQPSFHDRLRRLVRRAICVAE